MNEQVKNAKKYFTMLLLPYVIGNILINILQPIFLKIAEAVNPQLVENMNTRLVIGMIPIFCICYPIIIFLVKKFISDEQPIEKKKAPFGKLAIAFLIAISCLYFGNIIGSLVTKLFSATNAVVAVVMDTNVFVQILLIVIIAPIYEEYLYRKLLIDRAIKYGEGVAIFLSAFVFGLIHGNFSQFFYAFFLGALFAYIYIRTGNIKYTMGFHICINFIGSIVATTVLEKSNITEMLKVLAEGNVDLYMQMVMDNIAGVLIYFLYAFLLFGCAVAGLIILIVNKKKLYLLPREEQIEKKDRFNVLILNIGMIALIVLSIGVFIVATLGLA